MYEDFCQVKLMLHHPFKHLEELLSIDNTVYLSYREAYTACCLSHSYPEDYYAEPETDRDEIPDDDEDEEDLEVEPRIEDEEPLADFEVYAQRRANDHGQLDGLASLGTRHLDWEYN